jgi:hypothetical protein
VAPFGGGVGQLEATANPLNQIIATFEGSAATGGVAGELVRVSYHGSSGQMATT